MKKIAYIVAGLAITAGVGFFIYLKTKNKTTAIDTKSVSTNDAIINVPLTKETISVSISENKSDIEAQRIVEQIVANQDETNRILTKIPKVSFKSSEYNQLMSSRNKLKLEMQLLQVKLVALGYKEVNGKAVRI